MFDYWYFAFVFVFVLTTGNQLEMPVGNGGVCCAAGDDCDDDCCHVDLLSYTCRRCAGTCCCCCCSCSSCCYGAGCAYCLFMTSFIVSQIALICCNLVVPQNAVEAINMRYDLWQAPGSINTPTHLQLYSNCCTGK